MLEAKDQEIKILEDQLKEANKIDDVDLQYKGGIDKLDANIGDHINKIQGIEEILKKKASPNALKGSEVQ